MILAHPKHTTLSSRSLTLPEAPLVKLPPPLPNIDTLKCGLLKTRSATKHTQEIHDLCLDEQLDCRFITESWLTDKSKVDIEDMLPDKYCILMKNRTNKQGGGIAITVKESVKITMQNPSWESLICTSYNKISLVFTLCYRPPGPKTNNVEDFTYWATSLVIDHPHITMLGDLTFWFNDQNDGVMYRVKKCAERF